MSVRNKERFTEWKYFFQKLNWFFFLVVADLYISKLTWKVTSHMKYNFCNHWWSASSICSRHFLYRTVPTSAEKDSEIALELALWKEKTVKWLWLASEIREIDEHLNSVLMYLWTPCTTESIIFVFFFSITNQTPNYPNLFCYKTIHVSSNFSAHHQEFSTVHSALVNFMQVWWPLPSRVRIEHPDSAQIYYDARSHEYKVICFRFVQKHFCLWHCNESVYCCNHCL